MTARDDQRGIVVEVQLASQRIGLVRNGTPGDGSRPTVTEMLRGADLHLVCRHTRTLVRLRAHKERRSWRWEATYDHVGPLTDQSKLRLRARLVRAVTLLHASTGALELLEEGTSAPRKLPLYPEPKPRGELCEKMCKKCPFRPDGSGYAQDHPDLPRIIRAVELGLPFYCHETALMDPRTKLDKNGDPDGVQSHFRICRGGWEHYLTKWRERRDAMLAKKQQPYPSVEAEGVGGPEE